MAQVQGSVRTACHPFGCRLAPDAAFDAFNPSALVGAGFASFSLAIFTAFRIAPILTWLLITRTEAADDEEVELLKQYAPYIIIGWLTTILSVLTLFALFLWVSNLFRFFI